MDKVFFKIVIPCYNSLEYINKCIESIERQTFTNYKIIVINDACDDDTYNIVKKLSKKYKNIICIDPKVKLYNGGARNIGINYNLDSEYTLFLDNDDWFENENVLQQIYENAIDNKNPDCIRLSYYCLIGNNKQYVELNEKNPKDMVNSLYIAPWTKCIKSNLVVLFPENTLIEDVVQHIAQIDNIESISTLNKPAVVWNRNNINSCSLKENQHRLQNGKRVSSIYRNIADLMDLVCKHDYCEEHRKWRIKCYKDLVREGKEETF